MEFTEKENEIIDNAIFAISEILLSKMNKRLRYPTIEGDIEIENEDKKVCYSFVALSK